MELLHKIEKYARELGYEFLIRIDDEHGEWLVHFYSIKYIDGTRHMSDNFASVYTNTLQDTLKWLFDRIENELIKEDF